MTDRDLPYAGPDGTYLSVESSALRNGFSEFLDEARFGARRVLITRYGRPVAAMVSLRDFEKLRALDHATDRRMVRNRAERSGESLSFEEFEAATLQKTGEEPRQVPLRVLAYEIAKDIVSQADLGRRSIIFNLASSLLKQRFGAAYRFSSAEEMEARRWVIESLPEAALQEEEAAAALASG